ncbi:hypothetical protein KJ575_02790, partial [Patescibacteria group bacterium]|nr:hypothetical protein [Patescibacteria group bacterium]
LKFFGVITAVACRRIKAMARYNDNFFCFRPEVAYQGFLAITKSKIAIKKSGNNHALKNLKLRFPNLLC